MKHFVFCGIDGNRAEDILDKEKGVEAFLATIHDELKSKSYHPSPVKRVYISKADAKKRPLGIPTLNLKRLVQPLMHTDPAERD